MEVGYQLDPGPSILIMTRVYDELFATAGRKREDYIQFDRLPVISRVHMEGYEALNLPSDERECLALLNDLSSEDATSLKDLLYRIEHVEPLLWTSVFKSTIDRPWQLLNMDLIKFGRILDATQPFRKVVDRLFKLPLLRAFFYGFPSYGGQSYNSPSPGSFLIPYYMIREGVWTAQGGVRAIPEALYRLSRELGVEFRFSAEVTDVQTKSGLIDSVVLQTGERLCANGFVINQDRYTFAKLLGRQQRWSPSYSYFTMHFGVRAQFPDLEHHNLFIPQSFASGFDQLYENNAFPEEPIIYLNATKAADPAAAPVGSSNLFAVVTSPSLNEDGFPVEEAACRVKSGLRNFGLDWSDALTDFERVQSPYYFESKHLNYRGSLYGAIESQRLWGMFPASNRDPQYKNLTYCGGSVQPGAGLPMVILSGKFAVESLVKASKVV